MEFFRGLRDVEKYLLKFLPNRDVVRLQRVCKTWQNMLQLIEFDRIQRLPADYRGIWRNLIVAKYDNNCMLFLVGFFFADGGWPIVKSKRRWLQLFPEDL